jgi:hypothetical protein
MLLPWALLGLQTQGCSAASQLLIAQHLTVAYFHRLHHCYIVKLHRVGLTQTDCLLCLPLYICLARAAEKRATGLVTIVVLD